MKSVTLRKLHIFLKTGNSYCITTNNSQSGSNMQMSVEQLWFPRGRGITNLHIYNVKHYVLFCCLITFFLSELHRICYLVNKNNLCSSKRHFGLFHLFSQFVLCSFQVCIIFVLFVLTFRQDRCKERCVKNDFSSSLQSQRAEHQTDEA